MVRASLDPTLNPADGTISVQYKADLLRSDLTLGRVWFVNYSALNPAGVTKEQLDLHGTGMLPVDVELLAHRWLQYSRSVDVNHDGRGRAVGVLESFMNSDVVASPTWPLNTHVIRLDVAQEPSILQGLRDGTLNCVSFDAFTFNRKVRVPLATAKSYLPREALQQAPL